jgi:Glycosyl hydrolase family 76
VVRTAAATALVAGLLLSTLSVGQVQMVSAVDTGPNLSRASASYNAMQQYFYKGDGLSLYNEHYPAQVTDNLYSYEWPFSQAMAGTIDLSTAIRVGSSYQAAVQDRFTGLSRYFSSNGAVPNKGITPTYPSPPGYDSYVDPPYGGSGDKFYDDNDWVGLTSVQYYLLTGDLTSLARARTIFNLIVAGWDNDPSHPAPGGVFWTQAPWSQDRNTVSNMPSAELGLRLYQITRDTFYLDWARKMYDWVNTNLRDPSDGLYWDHINLAGQIEKTKWSYNQGTPIGTNVLFYEITGDRSYLQQAEQIANAALAYLNATNLLHTQDPIFDAIFFKNLLLLHAVDHNPTYVQAMQDYADWAWNTARDPATGVFTFPNRRPTDLLDQAAMVQIYAVLSWQPKDYVTLY